MNKQEIEYCARKLLIAKIKVIAAIAEMENEAGETARAFGGLTRAINDAIIKWQLDIYYSWITLPYRKDNLN